MFENPPIRSNKLLDALAGAGVISVEDKVRRVVIDAQYDNAVVVYVERYGDDRLLDVVPTLEGVQITSTPAPPPVVFDPSIGEGAR